MRKIYKTLWIASWKASPLFILTFSFVCLIGCSQTPSKPTPSDSIATKEPLPKIGEDEPDDIIFPPRKPQPPPSLPYSSPIEITPDQKNLELPFPADNSSLSNDKALGQKASKKQKKKEE